MTGSYAAYWKKQFQLGLKYRPDYANRKNAAKVDLRTDEKIMLQISNRFAREWRSPWS